MKLTSKILSNFIRHFDYFFSLKSKSYLLDVVKKNFLNRCLHQEKYVSFTFLTAFWESHHEELSTIFYRLFIYLFWFVDNTKRWSAKKKDKGGVIVAFFPEGNLASNENLVECKFNFLIFVLSINAVEVLFSGISYFFIRKVSAAIVFVGT